MGEIRVQTTDLWAGTALFLDSTEGAYTCKLIRDDAEVRVDQVRRSPPGLQGALFWRRADSQSGYNTVFPWIPPPPGLLRILRRNSHAGAPEAGLSH